MLVRFVRTAGVVTLLAGIAILARDTTPTVQAAPADGPDIDIPKAIKKGVEWLKDKHAVSPSYSGGSHGVGTACLGGLALLESGVKPSDAVVQQIASFVRGKALETYGTYEVSLILMFLDRLGSKSDEGLIQFMGVRLVSGQGADGTWSYTLDGPQLNDAELKRIKGLLVKDTKLVSRPDVRLPGPKEPAKKADQVKRDDLPVDPSIPEPLPPEPEKKDEPKPQPKPVAPINSGIPGLHAEAQKALKLANTQNGPVGRAVNGDHSNVQFATVGVWVARRHGVPVKKCLEALEKHYRDCQSEDGGWGYVGKGGSTPSMTCAGLMGLAIGMNSNQPVLRTAPNADPLEAPKAQPANAIGGARDPGKDVAIKKGLTKLGDYLAAAAGAPEGDGKKPRRRFRGGGALGGDLYFMWSLERVGVIYCLETIGNVDWYACGSEALIGTQQANGSWGNSDVDTAFGLLFLNRANFTQDLSSNMKGKVRDPGAAEFRSVDPADLEKIFKGGVGTVKKNAEPNPALERPAPKVDPTLPRPVTDPPANVDAATFEGEANRLSRALAASRPPERDSLIAKLRDSKGAVYTEALLRGIAKMDGDGLKQARDALAVRLTRMRADTLREMLKDENRELRRASALACAMKEDRSHVPDLINAIGDTESTVSRAAKAALKTLTGQDFGPETDSAADKTKAIQAWRNWWNKNKGN